MSLNLNLGDYKRRDSVSVKVGNIVVGGNNPIVVQSMTNTDTADIEKTFQQVLDLYNAGTYTEINPQVIRSAEDRFYNH